MVEEVEGGATLAWRLLATLEGSSLLLATSALLAYTARKKLAHMQRHRRPVKNCSVGAETTSPVGLQAIADLVSEDIYNNLQLLERLSVHVRRGGSIAWACTGMAAGNFRDAGETFDLVLKANLQRVANM
ncbi:hypothetical protein ACJJTC_005567 [Scirpophaga incertulas]